VRNAVAAEWRAVVADRQPRRRIVPWLAAASLAAVAVTATIVVTRVGRVSDVATVARLEGTAEVRHGSQGGWQPLTAGAALRDDDAVRTRRSSRVALRRADGLEIRLDGDATLAFDDAARAELSQGSVYVDAGRGGSAERAFTLETGFGSVHHVGTQYAATVATDALTVAVREGAVAIESGSQPVIAQAGEQLAVARDGSIERRPVARFGETWRWAEAVSPGFAIEGRSLDEFLGWAARETGRQLVYGSPGTAREAEATRLKGSISGMSPDAALVAVLATAPSLRLSVSGEQLRVESSERR
jgi:ferric-dicitrate binding protein FerR (iron transport regulator)